MLPQDWFIPPGVKLAFSQRQGGVSLSPFDSLNLGDHVGDDPELVRQNRLLAAKALGMSAEPAWLQQVHGIELVNLDQDVNRTADGSFCRSGEHVCVVMTADCLPVLICDRAATQVAAVHAGWRGLCNGIVEAAIAEFDAPAEELLLYLGPCIGPDAFEVGGEVRAQFIAQHAETADFFKPSADRFLADLQGIARYRAERLGVGGVYQLPHCTYSLSADYFSYRREAKTGRMASFIWLEN
ncbi:peptidoglycan editing factor PgeF [Shewanella sp. Isolate7]|uniref:peptidoglycan editing factor PgeF n=1 Tax=Shewanella sp. Isolate7 TaxID=2908528 RepID=UPI001EFD9BE9|nr:peptidoglycan editing factor PgeF [Shewanella sp. Isolate7]MCG9720516.1 peptidoglycan editing factor PgeF [Shewanella sp. Isolate7]